MPNYKEFEGVNLITNPTQKTIAQVLIKNELGGVSNGYQLDHAGTSNSGYSFGGNQMDLSKNANGREIFSTIIKAELGDNFYNSIKDRVVQTGNQNILTQQEQNQINSALSSNYGKQLINQAFVDEVNVRSSHVDDFAKLLNTTFTNDVKIALVDYDNQFYIDFTNTGSSSMRTKLQNILNKNGEITLEDVENSVRSTGYYNSSPSVTKSQEKRIQDTRKMIEDAGLISDGSDSTDSLKNSLVTTLATITVTAQKEAAAKSWFETFSDSLGSWTGSVTNFMKEAASDVVNFFSSPSESLSKIGSWISSAFTYGESEKTPDPSTINNSLLNLEINTNLTSGFAGGNDLGQSGVVIGDADWRLKIPTINNDGITNVLPGSIGSDGFRAGNQELSSYQNFAKDVGVQLTNLDNLIFSNSQTAQNLWSSTSLTANLSNLANFASDSRSYVNIDPVVLDLNGDGVKLTSYNDSEVTFDVDNDGKQERTGWVSNQDGILVDDVNGDGKINNITETISEYYNTKDGSVADADGKYSTDGLAALKKLDSNHDGKFNSQDAKWNDLRVWMDANGDAQTDAGELKTLNEAGIKEFDLSNITQANKERNAGNIIFSRTTYKTADNKTKEVAAVDFTTNPIGYEFNDVNLGKLATAEDGTKSLVISDTNGATVTASSDTAQNIFGNVGDDIITGDARDNWISGGAGSDTLKGGVGDDILIIDSEDKQENIDGGDGRDVVIINSDQGVSFNLNQSHVETAVGGNGDDVLIGGGTSNVFIDGGSGDDIIIGGAADDALAGSDGNDYVDGGYGDDVVRGHRGNDVLIGGEGNDYLEGGLDDDQVFGGAGNDVIMEGAGNDQIDGGDGYDLVKYNGSYKDYKISRDGTNYKVQDLTTGNIDSIKNIEGVRFNDVTIKLIDGNISPLPVADIIQVQNKTDAVFISVNDLLKNDLDVEGDNLTLVSVTNSVGGFAELVKDGSGNVTGVRWTPDKSFIGNMSFDYDVKDSKGAYTIIEQYSNDGTSVTAAMKARVTFKMASDPTDDLYAKQWYLSEVNIQKAWQDYTGKGVKIGVFEKGDFNINHTELDGNTTQSYKDDVAFRQVEQFSQHKTTVSGVIAAERNGTGIVGVAYDASLEGYSWDADETGLANLKNVDIANNSWGAVGEFADNFSDPNNFYANAKSLIEDSVALGRNGLGTINIFAGGNSRADGDNVNYHNFQNSRFVITTGSINQPGDLATLTQASTPFSNPGDAILVSATGSNINSTGNLLTNANGSQFLGEFASSQGTSFSAPIVSGIVALMLQANPNLGYRDVQKILALSARQFNDPNTTWQENGATNWNGGAMHFSHDYGFGEVDAATAVRLAETWNEVSDYYNENSLIASDNSGTQIVDNGVVIKQFTISNSNMHNIETVEVQVSLTDFNISDLTIKLISPSGTESILMDKPGSSVYSGGLNFNFSSRAFLGENVDGNWKLQITDSKTGDISYLNSWQLKFYGELNDGKNDTYIYTDEFAKLTDGARGIIIDGDGGNDTINAAAVSSDSVINLNAGQISNIAGKDVLITGGTKGAQYYQKQELLPVKQSQLTSVNSQIVAKNQALVANNAEFAGIDAAISTKYQQINAKYSEYQSAVQNVANDWLSKNTFWTAYRDGATYYIYRNNVTDAQTTLVKDDAQRKINNYNGLVAAQNQKASEYQSLVSDYNSLIARRAALPAEISGLQNDILALTKQATQLQSDINFINAYLNAFEDGKTSIIENAYAGDGNDTIIGNDQDNKIWGGRGLNTEAGGAGKDTFIIKENSVTQDTITDFKIGEDKIDLSDFDSLKFSDLIIAQQGNDVLIAFSSGQKILLKNLNSDQITINSFTGIEGAINVVDGTSVNDNLIGTNLIDSINGFAGDDKISGGGGNDYIKGEEGNDILTGGNGDDIIYGGKDDDTIYGDGDIDFASNQLINSTTQSGNDKLYGGLGNDTIDGFAGNDYIDGGVGNDLLIGGDGDDVIVGGDGTNEIQGGAGNDTIYLDGTRNDIWGDDGIDNFIISERLSLAENKYDLIYDFDAANEKIDLSAFQNIDDSYDFPIVQVGSDSYVVVKSENGYKQYVVLVGVNATKLSAQNFVIKNDAPIANQDDVAVDEDNSVIINVFANDSDDKTAISSLNKNNILVTNPQNGIVKVNNDGTVTYTPNANFNGDDSFKYTFVDSGGLQSSATVNIKVNAVNDAPVVTKIISDQNFYIDREVEFSFDNPFIEVDGDSMSYSATMADGSSLPDWLVFDSVSLKFKGIAPDNTAALNIKLIATDQSGLSNSTNFNLNIKDHNIYGTSGNDTLNGSAFDDIIKAKEGLDIVNGFAGNDEIDGAAGNDVLTGGSGNDIIFGGDGNDSIYGDGDFNSNNKTIVGYDTQVGNDTLYGGNGNDVILGLAGNDYIDGSVGDDILLGGDGDDILIGGSGNNQLQGGKGNDIIDFGSGAESSFVDSVNYGFGEEGSDTFVISDKSISFKHKFDVIADFDVNDPNEKIDLSRIKGVDQYSDLQIFQNGADAYVAMNSNFFGYSELVKLEKVNIADLNSSKFIITNEAPKAISDNASTNEDNSVIINLLSNDSDDKTTLKGSNINIVTNPTHGFITVNSDGTVTYRPNANFNGDDSFEYKLTDSGGLNSENAKVNLVVNPVNDAPVIVSIIADQKVYITKDINLKVNNIFTEVDGESLAYSVTLDDGSALPSWLNFNAQTLTLSGQAPRSASIFNIKVTATDQSGLSNSETFKVTVDDNIIFGTNGDDVISGTSGNDVIDGGEGNDVINAGAGSNIIFGGAGNDKLYSAGNDTVNAGSGNDEINITDGGNKNITGGDGSDIYKISPFTGDITITDFAVSDPNERIDLEGIATISSFSDLVISQSGSDAIIQISSSQKIILKNTNKNILTADKFVIHSNHFDGSPINDRLFGDDGNDIINGFGGNDYVYLSGTGSDVVDLGYGNDSFIVSGNGFYGNDNVTGGLGNDKFSIDLGYSYYDTTNYILTINDFEATNPNEKIYISNGWVPNVDFTKDLKIDQIGSDVQISLSGFTNGKKLILKNVNKADLNENNIVLPKVEYEYATQASKFDDNITYDPNAGSANTIGKDIKIPISGTVSNISTYADSNQTLISFYVVTDNGWVKQNLVNASVLVGQNLTTYTYNSFDPAKDRLGIDSSYAVTKYSDLPIVQEGSDVAINFTNQKVKIILKNVNLIDLQESDFIFYNHSTNGNDLIDGGNGNDHLEGGKGNDQINGGFGNDEIYGGDGDDSLTDYEGVNKLYGGAGDDSLGVSMYNNSTSNNELYGGEGDDLIQFSTGGTNVAKGGIGNDEFIVYGGDNEIYGEEGVDDFIIDKSYSVTFDVNGNYIVTDAASSTTIHDFDPTLEKVILSGVDQDNFDQLSIIQDGNDVVFNLSSVQTLRLSNVTKSSLNQDNIIIPDKHIQDRYYYTFDDRTNEYSVRDLNKLMAESNDPYDFYQGPVAEIASDYDPVLMKMVSNFDATKDKIHLGKIKTLEKFEDLKITQHSIAQSYGAPSEFTLIDLGDGSFVKLDGFYTLTADNFTFNKAPTANLSSANINEDSQIVLDVVSNTVDNDDDVLSITEITNPLHGSAIIITDEQGRQKISYIPTPNFNGIDQFNYTISDGRGGVVTKTLTVTVNSVNDNPTATIIEANVNENNSVIIDVLAGTSDADGDQLSIVGIYGVTNGVANVVDGKIVYRPNANYKGLAKFDYTISDGNGGFVTKDLTVTVKAPPAPKAPSQDILKNFNADLYLAIYPDVKNAIKSGSQSSALNHFMASGYQEGRVYDLEDYAQLKYGVNKDAFINVMNNFNEDIYNAIYPDIKNAVKSGNQPSGLMHFIMSGYQEGRAYDLNSYAQMKYGANKDAFINAVNNFDADFYSAIYSDIKNALKSGGQNSALSHFITVGYQEGRAYDLENYAQMKFGANKESFINAVNNFDADFYSTIYSDIKNALKSGDQSSALNHFIMAGYQEGRAYDVESYAQLKFGSNKDAFINAVNNFNEDLYLATYSDIKNAVKSGAQSSGLSHFIMSGYKEGRAGTIEDYSSRVGKNGSDMIVSKSGSEVMIGGAGNDQFIFKNLSDSTDSQTDLILDFIKSEDKINLSGLGFDDVSVGSGSSSSLHGLEYYFDGKNTVIEDPNSNFAVKLAGNINLEGSDFIL